MSSCSSNKKMATSSQENTKLTERAIGNLMKKKLSGHDGANDNVPHGAFALVQEGYLYPCSQQ